MAEFHLFGVDPLSLPLGGVCSFRFNVSLLACCHCLQQNALAVKDDFGSAYLLGERMHGPTCLGQIERNARNMPKILVHFG